MKNFTSLAVALLIGDASAVVTDHDWDVRNNCEDFHYLVHHRGTCGLNKCLFDPKFEQNYGSHKWSCDKPTFEMCEADPNFKNCEWYEEEFESYTRKLEELKNDTHTTGKGQKEEDLYNRFERRIQELRKHDKDLHEPKNWDPKSIKKSDHYHHELLKYTKAITSDENEFLKWDHNYYAE